MALTNTSCVRSSASLGLPTRLATKRKIAPWNSSKICPKASGSPAWASATSRSSVSPSIPGNDPRAVPLCRRAEGEVESARLAPERQLLEAGRGEDPVGLLEAIREPLGPVAVGAGENRGAPEVAIAGDPRARGIGLRVRVGEAAPGGAA